MIISIQLPAQSTQSVKVAVDALVGLNEIFLRTHPRIPPLYSSGVYYKIIPPPERFLVIPLVLKRGSADCDSLTGYRVAELRVSGEDPWASAIVERRRRGRGLLYHVLVRRGDGSTEDPSRILGMGRL